MNTVSTEALQEKAFRIRCNIITTIIKNGEGHAGPALSCADILACLFFDAMRMGDDGGDPFASDKFILSAGHKCLALYGTLVEKGVVPRGVLASYNHLGSPLPGHPDRKKLPGIDFSTGSLGHGLSVACGMCMAAKMCERDTRAFVVMGDGEQTEGTVWEAATFAAFHKLDNLVAFIDRNGLQVGGRTCDIMDTSPLDMRYAALGWRVFTVDGHDIDHIRTALTEALQPDGRPVVIICDTVKAKGLPFAEGNYKYHHWDPTEEEKTLAMEALEKQADEMGWTL